MNTKKKISIKELLVGALCIILMIKCAYASNEQIDEISAGKQVVDELKREAGKVYSYKGDYLCIITERP